MRQAARPVELWTLGLSHDTLSSLFHLGKLRSLNGSPCTCLTRPGCKTCELRPYMSFFLHGIIRLRTGAMYVVYATGCGSCKQAPFGCFPLCLCPLLVAKSESRMPVEQSAYFFGHNVFEQAAQVSPLPFLHVLCWVFRHTHSVLSVGLLLAYTPVYSSNNAADLGSKPLEFVWRLLLASAYTQ
jgi:hypothetical protein